MDMRSFGLSEDDLRQLGYDMGNEPEAPDTPEGTTPGASGASRRPASPSLRIWVATLLLLPLVGWASSLQRRLPDPAPTAAPDTEFSSGRALAQLVEIAQRPHPTGSPDLERVRNVIVARLASLGLASEVQVTTSVMRDSDGVRAATVRNVLARLPGADATGAVAIVAHYDTAPLSPGAGDNGIGVATVLETVRALVAGAALRNDVIVVFTDADELGLLGSNAFAEEHPWAAEVELALVLSSRGTGGPTVLFESTPSAGWLVPELATADLRHTATSLGRALGGSAIEGSMIPAVDDHPTVALSALGGLAWGDQPRDTRDRVSERTLQHAGEQLVSIVGSAAERDLRAEESGLERAYLSLPGVGLIHYPVGWGVWISLGLLATWALIGGVVRLRRGTRNGVLAGIGVGLATVGLSGLGAASLWGPLSNRHPEFGLLQTAFYRDGPHILALAAIALAVASVAYATSRRWFRVDEVLFGAMAVPLALVLWLTFASPFSAPSVQWPLSITLLGTATVTVLGPRRGGSAWSWAFILLMSGAALAIAVPSLELIAGAWTLRRATELGTLLGVGTVLLLPLMEWLRAPRAWATPALGLVTSAALVTLYMPALQGGTTHPEPTTLVYLTDEVADPGPAPNGSVQADTSRARTVLGKWLTIPGAGEWWSRSWVGDPLGGSTDPGVLLIGPDSLYEIAGSGPDGDFEPPNVAIVSVSSAAGRRRLVVEVESGLRGEMMGIAIPDGVVAEIVSAGNAAWDATGEPVRSLMHWGEPDGGALRIGMTLGGRATETELIVLEHHLRPREVLGDYFFQRPDSLIAAAGLGSDRVIQRTRVSLEVPDSIPPPEIR